MNKLFVTSAIVACALLSNAVSAQEAKTAATNITTSGSLSVKIVEVKPLQFRILVENPSRQKVNLYLVDNEQNILFDEYAFVEAKYGKILDLSNVVDGTYTFMVSGKKDKVNQSFEIVTKTNRTALAKNEK